MKKNTIIMSSLLILLLLSACNISSTPASESVSRSVPELSSSVEDQQVYIDPSVYSPYDSVDYIDKDHLEVETLLKEAGFNNISLQAVDDINSYSNIPDGAVVSVAIDSITDFTTAAPFNKDAVVLITYHNIPKVTPPMTSSEAKGQNYMDVGKMFYEVGFVDVNTTEVYDIPADEQFETVLEANGQRVDDIKEIPFDSNITVIGHYPIPEYATKITIDFEANWIFSKYDVSVKLNDSDLGTLPHGEGTIYNLSLVAGNYHLSFTSTKNDEVSGFVDFSVNSGTNATYHISCHSTKVKVDEIEFSQALADDDIMMPYSSNYYLRKDYTVVTEELKKLGFKKVDVVSTADDLWSPSAINSVVAILINNESSFDRDKVFSKNSSVTVSYHKPDFSFEMSSISVTEKEIFEIPYQLKSNDSIDTLSFSINNQDVLQRNDDGTYTALIPGHATVEVSAGGHLLATCNVEIDEIIVPIESVVFAQQEIDVVVGNVFDIEYSFFPENANYTETSIEFSDAMLEQIGEKSFYANETGDTEINIYQDDRLVGNCLVHAVVVDIEDFSLAGTVEGIVIGDAITLAFNLMPEQATAKGISIVSSNPDIAAVAFDERGEHLINVTGISEGDATIIVTLPNGVVFTYPITVNEIIPEEISIIKINSEERIEVGTPIVLDINWNPDSTSVKEVKWTSSNSKVIKVNDEGTLEAVGVGTADITAKHKSGVSATIALSVEPTLVTQIGIMSDRVTRGSEEKIYKGDSFTINVSVWPENATNQKVVFSSSDTSVVKVSDKGVVTAVDVGTAIITATSSDGPSQTMEVIVSPSPQKFKITWSASLISSNHVGSNWKKYFSVNDEPFSSGSTITIDPESTFTIDLTIIEDDDRPDEGGYYEILSYSEELWKNGYAVSKEIFVTENGGKYSGNSATWKIKISITPVK